MTEDLTQRRVPTIPATAIYEHAKGYCWSEYMVRLPDDFIADDLKEPSIWALVQRTHHSLRPHDRVYIVAYDESWVAEAIVAESSMSTAVLAKPRITTMPAKYENLLETEDYRVRWVGTGYVVERKSDSHKMTSPISSKVLAERQLWELTPRAAR